MKRSFTYGLSHIALKVKDLHRTKQFYTEVFDMEVMYNEELFLQMSTPDSHDIIVFERASNVSNDTGGIVHFGFRLIAPEHIKPMRDRILRAGGTILNEGEFVKGSPFIFFSDPDGYTIEIWYELMPDEL